MKKWILALAAVFSFGSQAAVEVVSPETWTLYRGTTIVQPRVPYASKAECRAAAALNVQHICVGRETFIPRPDAPVITVTAQFSPSSIAAGQSASLVWASTGATSCSATAKGQTVALPATSGTLDAGPQSESLSAVVTCGGVSSTAALTVSTAPPPTCTTPRPAQETRTQACPAGTTGNWSQSRNYDAATYPTCWTAGAWTPAEAPAGSCVPVAEPPPPPPPVGGVATTFDALYAPGFTLKALDNAAIVQQPRPAKSAGINAPSYTDPAYGTKVFKITDTATDGNVANVSHIRHDYSRRQAFNADSSRYIAQDGNGFWALFDGSTFKRINGKRSNGMLVGMAGDAEPFWHPTDPNILWYNDGGMRFLAKDVRTDTDTVLVDFSGRLPWSGTQQVWTKAEGSPSADGRYFGLLASAYNSSTQTVTCQGLIVWDRQTDTITTLPASAFGGAMPDHVSMSPSGKYIVPSWAFNKTLGTRAYTRDFASFKQLHTQSEHSDLAFGPNGEDFYVVTDYDAGQIRAVDMSTGASTNLLSLYPVSGGAYSAHVSGKAFKRPGWVVVSTYADFSNYSTYPASPQQPMYRKVMAVELKAGGRVINIAHTQASSGYGGYFGEHQATVNLDFTRVVWATNFNVGTRVESVMVGLPSTAIPK